MRKMLISLVFIYCLFLQIPALAAEYYHGITTVGFALALQDFDEHAAQPGSSEFAFVDKEGKLQPWKFINPAMKKGWQVVFDETEIKQGALIIFGNIKNNTSVLSVASKMPEGIQLSWHMSKDGKLRQKSFSSLAEAEKYFEHSFVAAINPDKGTNAKKAIGVGDKLPKFYLLALDSMPNLEQKLLSDDTEKQAPIVSVLEKVTVLNFWATWCTYCTQELPDLNRFAQKHQDDVNFYAVNLRESKYLVKNFMTANHYNFSVLLDESGIANLFGTELIPKTIVVDKNGVIRYEHVGVVNTKEMENVLAQINQSVH